MAMANSEPATLEDFHAGRASRFTVNVDPKEGTDGRSIWTATVATEDGVKLGIETLADGLTRILSQAS